MRLARCCATCGAAGRWSLCAARAASPALAWRGKMQERPVWGRDGGHGGRQIGWWNAMKRVVSLWLPNFATDRLIRRRRRGQASEVHLATVRAGQGGLRLAAVSPAAAAAGL